MSWWKSRAIIMKCIVRKSGFVGGTIWTVVYALAYCNSSDSSCCEVWIAFQRRRAALQLLRFVCILVTAYPQYQFRIIVIFFKICYNGKSVRRKSNRLRQRPLREDFLRRKNSAYSHWRMPNVGILLIDCLCRLCRHDGKCETDVSFFAEKHEKWLASLYCIGAML